jgi:hypothetical protein
LSRPVSRVAFILLVMGFVLSSCGNREPGGTGSSSVPTENPVRSRSDWCALYRESLPSLSSPNPDGQELAVLDLYVERYVKLRSVAPGVSLAASEAMGQLAVAYTAIRARVAQGEHLSDVLAEKFASAGSDLVVAGTAAAAEAAAVCP